MAHSLLSELRHVLTSLGEKLSDEDVDALLANVSIDANGSVNYEGLCVSAGDLVSSSFSDFVRLVMSS